ncbi:MAG: hypothetical protein AB1467_00725 [Candidatus Diapherotrites archaeon]
MKKSNGIISLEAMLSLAVFLGLISVMLSALSMQSQKALSAKNFFEAKSSSLRCAELVNSVFSNSGGKFKVKENCFVEGGESKSIVKDRNSASFIIAEKVLNIKGKDSSEIEVKLNAHYK